MDLSPAFQGLSDKQRLYVQARLEGNTPGIAARMAGVKDPEIHWKLMEAVPVVREALRKGREISIAATGVTRETVTEMLKQAFANATTAAEQVAAARELGKLHGVYEAQKVQHDVRVQELKDERELKALPTQELAKLAKLPVLEGEFIEVTPGKEPAVVGRTEAS